MMIDTEKARLLGPFATVEELKDRLLAGGSEFCFAVIGSYKILTEDPIHIQAPSSADEYKNVVQAHLDRNAQRLGYDGILSAASYAGDPNEIFSAQGTALKKWRSDVWVTCYGVLTQAEQKEIKVPTFDDLIAMLPDCPL